MSRKLRVIIIIVIVTIAIVVYLYINYCMKSVKLLLLSIERGKVPLSPMGAILREIITRNRRVEER